VWQPVPMGDKDWQSREWAVAWQASRLVGRSQWCRGGRYPVHSVYYGVEKLPQSRGSGC
jgi:hypothetical protein